MRCRVGIATGMVIVGEPVGTSFLLEKRLKLSALPSYTFGPFRLDTEATILFRRGEPVALGPRAVGLLRVLVEQRGVPVSKDTLIERAWAGLAVEESNLPVQIAALRRVLGEAPGGELWIQTLPRRGYRFVGPVDAQDEKVASGPAAHTDKPSLAVLPFNNFSGLQRGVECEPARLANPQVRPVSVAGRGRDADPLPAPDQRVHLECK